MISCPHHIWFIRHGETDWNREGRLQGQQDTPLNPRGREQASAVGRSLRKLAVRELDRLEASKAFVASPLLRTRRTMELAREAMGLPPADYALEPLLKELSFGDWEGLTWPEVEARDPKRAAERAADKWLYAPPDGESYAMLAQRLTPWVESLNGDVLAVSHGGVARALMHALGGVAPKIAAEAEIFQGRALLFSGGQFRWLG